MCWSISANAAGAANETTLGELGATLVILANRRFGDHLGRYLAELTTAQRNRVALPARHGLLDDLLVDALGYDSRQEIRVTGRHRVDLVQIDLDLSLLTRTEARGGILGRDHEQVDLVGRQRLARRSGIGGYLPDVHRGARDRRVEPAIDE